MRMTTVWLKGSIKLTISNAAGAHTYVSKNGEPPSAFIVRVLKTSNLMDGEQVWNYLKSDMECPKEYQGVGDERCWNCDMLITCPYKKTGRPAGGD